MTRYVPHDVPAGDSSLHEEDPAAPPLTRVDLRQMAAAVTAPYRNFVLSRVDDHCVRMAVMQGQYRWHRHPGFDECFVVLEGRLEIDLADGTTVALLPGETFTIPAGAVHRTRAAQRTVNLCFEHVDAYTQVEFMEPTAGTENRQQRRDRNDG